MESTSSRQGAKLLYDSWADGAIRTTEAYGVDKDFGLAKPYSEADSSMGNSAAPQRRKIFYEAEGRPTRAPRRISTEREFFRSQPAAATQPGYAALEKRSQLRQEADVAGGRAEVSRDY